ncbi:hypothetical protein BASA81_001253 [Batrachochytrium salamandrivorans]|nr:hypothetical protein BASA81_001253 [Batrachochytrium salamandrivorans]
MRKQMGIQQIKKTEEVKKSYGEKGKLLQDAKLEHVQRSLETFRGHLELFASKHRDAIQEDAEFRRTFTLMCNQLGVDVLASNTGFWGELFGLGDYYFDLGVKIIAMGISTRGENGGILEISKICHRLNAQNERNSKALARAQATNGSRDKNKKKPRVVLEEDVIRAVDKVANLGTLRVGQVGHTKVLFTVPFEWNPDQILVLEFACEQAQNRGVSPAVVGKRFGWLEDRANRALQQLAAESLCWLDQPSNEYWFPSFCNVNFT